MGEPRVLGSPALLARVAQPHRFLKERQADRVAPARALRVAAIGQVQRPVRPRVTLLHERLSAVVELLGLGEAAALVADVQRDPGQGPPRGRLVGAARALLDLERAAECRFGPGVVRRVVAERTHTVKDGVGAHVRNAGELAAGVHHGFGALDGGREGARRLGDVRGGALAFDHLDGRFEERHVGREGLETVAAGADDRRHHHVPPAAVQSPALAQRGCGARAQRGRLDDAAAAHARFEILRPSRIGEDLLERGALGCAEAQDLAARLSPAVAEQAVAPEPSEFGTAFHELDPAGLARPVLADGQLVAHRVQDVRSEGGDDAQHEGGEEACRRDTTEHVCDGHGSQPTPFHHADSTPRATLRRSPPSS